MGGGCVTHEDQFLLAVCPLQSALTAVVPCFALSLLLASALLHSPESDSQAWIPVPALSAHLLHIQHLR